LQPLVDLGGYEILLLHRAEYLQQALVLYVDAFGEEEESITLTIYCALATYNRLRFGPIASEIMVSSTHPLLMPYIEPAYTLSFEGQPAYPQEIVARLYQVHLSYFGEGYQLTKFLNPNLERTLQRGKGKIGDMPLTMMTKCREVLQNYGLKTKQKKYADRLMGAEVATEDFDEAATLDWKVLFFDDSFVIATDFHIEATLLENNALPLINHHNRELIADEADEAEEIDEYYERYTSSLSQKRSELLNNRLIK
jgi:hypothetical protein